MRNKDKSNMGDPIMQDGDIKAPYTSDIVLEERYRDTVTGFEGVATSITFFMNACERIALEDYDEERKKVVVEIFDAPRLVHVDSNKQATSSRPGGPGDMNSRPGANSR